MDSEIKKSIEDLKKTIQLLSQELANQLNSKLSGGFSFSNNLLNKLNIDLKTQPENLNLKKPLSNKNSSSFVTQKNINETDNKPLIDYDYIDENNFPDLLKNLKQYDRQMQQSQQQGSQAQFINFCKFAIDSIEAMLSQLIENEVKKISFKSRENRFLIACEKASTVFAETQYPMPQLFIENSGKIATTEIIKIENEKYFDTRQVERITLAKRIKIFSFMIDINIDNKPKDYLLRQKFDYIDLVKKYRNIDGHGSHKLIESRVLQQIRYKPAQKLYFNYKQHWNKVIEHVSWINQEIYKKIEI